MKRLLIALFAVSPLLALASPMSDGSYAAGYQMGENVLQAGQHIDKQSLIAGFNDAAQGKKPSVSAAKMKSGLQYLQKTAMAKVQNQMKTVGAANEKAGEAFLKANAQKKDVVTTSSGLQYKILKKGTGPKPDADSSVTVNYEGKLINGKVFDSSYKRGQPATFQVNQVIKGWQEALQMMPEGSTWDVYIPANLAYGDQAVPGIGPNQTLIFKVNLIKVNK